MHLNNRSNNIIQCKIVENLNFILLINRIHETNFYIKLIKKMVKLLMYVSSNM